MKYQMLFCFLSLFLGKLTAQNTCTLHVNISNFRSDKGQACLLLFPSEKGFYKDKSKAIRVAVPIKDKKVSYDFKNLAAGSYAVIALHDENKSEEMDTNMMGMPSEGFGVSRNAVGSFWQIKSFNEAKVIVNQADVFTSFSIGY